MIMKDDRKNGYCLMIFCCHRFGYFINNIYKLKKDSCQISKNDKYIDYID